MWLSGGHDRWRLDRPGLDGRLAEYMASPPLGEAFSTPETPRAARVAPEFYEDLQRATVGELRRPAAPVSCCASPRVPGPCWVPFRETLGASFDGALWGVEGAARAALVAREEMFRSVLEYYIGALLLSVRSEEAVKNMRQAGRLWTEIAEAASLCKTKHGERYMRRLLGNLRRCLNQRTDMEAARRLISMEDVGSCAASEEGAGEDWVCVASSRAGSPVRSRCSGDDLSAACEDEPFRPRCFSDELLAAGEGELARFLHAVDELTAAGVARNTIVQMAGYAQKNSKRNMANLVGRLREGEASALARMPGFYAALEEWRINRQDAAEDSGSESDGEEDACGLGSPDIRHTQVTWVLEAVDDLLDSGVSYRDLLQILGYDYLNTKQMFASVLIRTCGSSGNVQARVRRLRLAAERLRRRKACLARWGSPPRAGALRRAGGPTTPAAIAWAVVDTEGVEERARETIVSEEIYDLIGILQCMVGTSGHEAVWLPAIMRLSHLSGLWLREPASSVSGRVRGLPSDDRWMAMRRLCERPAYFRGALDRLRVCVLEGLSCIKWLSADQRVRVELADDDSTRRCARTLVTEAKVKVLAAAAVAKEEAEERGAAAAAEEMCRNMLGLSVARLNPVAWFRRTVLQLRGAGVAWDEISGMAGYAGRDPEANVRRLLGGLDTWRLEAMWGGLRRWERRFGADPVVSARSLCEAEAAGRRGIEDEEAAGLNVAIGRLREIPGMERVWMPHDVERLIVGCGYTYGYLAGFAGLEGAMNPRRSFMGLLKGANVGNGENAKYIDIFRRSMIKLDLAGAP